MSLRMTRSERERFLAEVHVGVISIEDPGRGPLAVPIWYGYTLGGELWIVTERASRKGRLLRYLGRELGDRYIEATGGPEARSTNVVVRMRPERWLSTDYSKQFSADA